ncbi:nitroreductase family protein [Stappia indica]|uniref:nitroreductase family protein n=1 Tax=Stappia indica TaxID=538381 RepID=UPI001D184EAE|nr:nitroreductase family protein [Stappia indica]MCC4243639.1 nitroreductase family protein [Stappia indica]
MTAIDITTLLEGRVSANLFDPAAHLAVAEVEELVHLATRAPSAYNLQNWRFVAVTSPEAKARLREAAYGQAKVSEAAVTFIIVGSHPDAEGLGERLRPSVEAGFMPAGMVADWTRAVADAYGADPVSARDEAVRSATLAASFMMVAAAARGLASGAMVGFDPARVGAEFDLTEGEVPVMLLAVGRAAPGNWPQKPRRPLREVLSHA